MKELVLYTVDNCPNCDMLRTYLADNQFEFDEHKNPNLTWIFPTLTVFEGVVPHRSVEGYDPEGWVALLNWYRSNEDCNCNKGRRE